MAQPTPEAEDTSHFQDALGRKIFCKQWKCVSADHNVPRALVFLCHGAGEHCQVYDILAKPLSAQDCLVCAHDHVGHGLSDGTKVHISKFTEYTDDMAQYMQIVRKSYPDLPVFVIGHSMGGTVSVKLGLDNPGLVRGMVLIGPALHPNPVTATPFLVSVARLVSWVIPSMQVQKIEPGLTCRDPQIVKRYEDDPLVWHGGLRARWAVEMLNVMSEIEKRANEVTWPLLILHGDDDKLCEISGSKMLHEKASSKDKTLKVIPGGYHQVHNEPDGIGQQTVKDIVDWITSRL